MAVVATLCAYVLASTQIVQAQTPPTLDVVFPAGGQAGRMVEVTATGNLGQPGLKLVSNAAGIRGEALGQNRFRLEIADDTPPGMYELWAVNEFGVSAPRPFWVGNRAESLETEPNDAPATATTRPVSTFVHGRIDKPGDCDFFRFAARRGQRVILECWSERIDSRLRAVLELFDETGRRLAVNRGYFGVDPLIDFRVPADGAYIVKIQDLIATGSAEHYYRLDVDAGPRVAFSVPAVVEQGKAARVTLYGWNLAGTPVESSETFPGAAAKFDRLTVDIPASAARPTWPLPVRQTPASAILEVFPYYLPTSHAPLTIGVTDVPVELDRSDNHSPETAQLVAIPSEVSGQLIDDDEQDWYALDVRRGDVLYLEGFAHRLQSPVDLEISVLDASGQRELVRFRDENQNVGGAAFPTSHLDPSGRWVAGRDGRHLVVVRNMLRADGADPRRVYRLSVRREEPDFQLAVLPRSTNPTALNVRRGGRELIDVVAFRRRGCDGPIQVAARDLPLGLECPPIWLGPGVDRATLVVSADRDATPMVGTLQLVGSLTSPGETKVDAPGASRVVRSGVVVRAGNPQGWGRLAGSLPLSVAGDAALRVSANAHEPIPHHLYGTLPVRHSPGGMIDVAVDIERRDADHAAPVKLSGVGLPDGIANQTAVIPATSSRGYVGFYLPPNMPLGRYSFVIQAETTVPKPDKKSEAVNLTAFSNPVTFDVQPGAFLVQVDPFAPRTARRGETVQIRYSAQRRNGFIGKMHTELAVPGRVTDVDGLRGRGETFVGQTESGTLQVIVNDDAPLGPQPFLRLFTVGVVEDQPTYFGSSPLPLEIVE